MPLAKSGAIIKGIIKGWCPGFKFCLLLLIVACFNFFIRDDGDDYDDAYLELLCRLVNWFTHLPKKSTSHVLKQDLSVCC